MFAVLSSARKALRPLAVLAAAVSLAACDPAMMGSVGGAPSVGPTITPGEPVTVALLVPKSDSGAGEIGRQLESAVRLALADAEGARIDLRVYDTAGSETTAAAQAQRAVDEGAKVILGPLFSATAIAASEQVVDEGINVIAFSNTASIARASNNLFVLGQTFDATAARLLSYASGQGRKSVVVLHPNDTPGAVAKAAIERAATRQGMLVTAQPYPLSIEAVNTAARNAGQLVSSGAADTVFITADATNAATPMFLQLLPENGAGPNAALIAGLTRWDVRPDLFDLPGADGAIFALPDRARQQNFDNRFRAANGVAPNPIASLGYDGMAAITALVSGGRRDALSGRALTRGTGFQGAGGLFRFLPDGTNERALAVAAIRNGQVVIVDPAPGGFGGAGS